MNAVVFVNGTIADADRAAISIFDHGFLYGEGIYETLRTYGGQPFLFDRHMHRLRHSAELMRLDVPFTDEALLTDVRQTMAAQKDLQEAYIRILLTRGIGELSYNPAVTPKPTLVIIVKPFPEPPAKSFLDGIKVSLVDVRRNHPQALNPMIKSNNLINNALAMQEALRRGADEALMLNQAGEIVECAQSNFFIVRDGVVMTPPLSAGLLPGITREFVLDVAASAHIPARETGLTPEDLETADEAFLTGTTREVTPIVSCDDIEFSNGRPGPVTRRLLDAFRARVKQLIPAASWR